MFYFILIRNEIFLLDLQLMKKNYFLLFLGSFVGILLSLGVGLLSSGLTQAAIPTWYAGLEKPFFSPPNWIFAPVWTLLYIAMGIGVGRVWFFGRKHPWGKTALYHFAAQLLFNGLWSFVFFGLKSPILGLLTILILWVLIQRTIFRFRLVDQKAAYLLYPYLAWVSFAGILNGAILYLNT